MPTTTEIYRDNACKIVRVAGLTNSGDSAVIDAQLENYTHARVYSDVITTPPLFDTGVTIKGGYEGGNQVDIPVHGYVRPLRQFLTVAGDGNGPVNSNNDYSLAETEFRLVPPGSHVAYLGRMIFSIIDNVNLVNGGWGAGLPLTNGMKIQVRDGAGVVHDLLGPQGDTYGALGGPWKTNEDVGSSVYDQDTSSYHQGGRTGIAKWDFREAGPFLRVDGGQGQYFAATLNDDFSGLISQEFWIEGFWGIRSSVERTDADRCAVVRADGTQIEGFVRALPPQISVGAHVDAVGEFDVVVVLIN